MDLAFTDEQDMLRDAVRGLCADAADTVRSLEDDPKGYDDGFWNQLATMGLTGLMLTEQHGGSAMGLLDAVVVYEEFGRSLVPSPHRLATVLWSGLLRPEVRRVAPSAYACQLARLRTPYLQRTG